MPVACQSREVTEPQRDLSAQPAEGENPAPAGALASPLGKLSAKPTDRVPAPQRTLQCSFAAKQKCQQLAGKARYSCAKRKNAIPQSRVPRDSSLCTREPFDCAPAKGFPV